MFSAAKIVKSKPFTTPSNKDTSRSNSSKKFTVDLNESMDCNRSFDTAQSLLNKSIKNFKQTKLCFPNKTNSENTYKNDSSLTGKSKTNLSHMEFFLMPVPNERPTTSKRPLLELSNVTKQKDVMMEDNEIPLESNPMNKNGRGKLVVIGKVDFCLKMHKLYPNLDILWDIYGKVVKILPGKTLCEHILILRTASNDGPVIQSIYYDFKNVLVNFRAGTCLRAVGNFMNENRLHTFKLEKIDCEKYEKDFSRIQNVISFSLLQQNIPTE